MRFSVLAGLRIWLLSTTTDVLPNFSFREYVGQVSNLSTLLPTFLNPGKNARMIQVAVLGAGSMGHGIAQVSAMTGNEAQLRDIESAIVDEKFGI